MSEPGAFIKTEDGRIIPDLDDEAMAGREKLKQEQEKPAIEDGEPKGKGGTGAKK